MRLALACRTEPAIEIYAKNRKSVQVLHENIFRAGFAEVYGYQQAFESKDAVDLFDAAHHRHDCAGFFPLLQSPGLESGRLLAWPLYFELQMTAIEAARDVGIAGDTHPAAPSLRATQPGISFKYRRIFCTMAFSVGPFIGAPP